LTLRFSDDAPFVSDALDAELRVTAPTGTEIELPKLEGLPKEVQLGAVRKVGPGSPASGEQVWSLHFKLEVLQAGVVELPALATRYRTPPESEWSVAETEPITIEFRSLLGDDPSDVQAKPNPDPEAWPVDWLFWTLLALACVTLPLVTAGWLAWRTRHRPVARPVAISPYRKAMEGLRRIQEAGYLERGEIERFYTELSAVIRHYIEDRFGLRAPEQTTEEFLVELSRRPVLADTQRRALEAFLEQSDLVKFALVRPTSSEGDAALHAARMFVEATRENLIEATAR
jgi:hypothetical protein